MTAMKGINSGQRRVIRGGYSLLVLQVIGYEHYIAYKGETGAKEHGMPRLEGKEYIVKDGDVLVIRHG